MPQVADKVIDHEMLFREPEYQDLFEKKKAFEFNHSEATIGQTVEWTKTEDYKLKNFARDSLVVNPAKACTRPRRKRKASARRCATVACPTLRYGAMRCSIAALQVVT